MDKDGVMDQKTLDMWTNNSFLKQWIAEVVDLCTPQDVHLVEGTEAEAAKLSQNLVAAGTLKSFS